MYYLNEKMNDPYTNWVNVEKGYNPSPKFKDFYSALNDSATMQRYGYKSVQKDNQNGMTIAGIDDRSFFPQMRYMGQMKGDLIHAILSEDNVVGGCAILPDSLTDDNIGLLLTKDFLYKLGYSEDSVPAYVDYLSQSVGADTFGVKIDDEGYARAPLPVLGVVNRLPMNMDVVASRFLYYHCEDDNLYPLCMNNEKYQRELRFFVSDYITNFEDVVKSCVIDSLQESLWVLPTEDTTQKRLKSWKPGSIYTVSVGSPQTPTLVLQKLTQKILNHYSSLDVCRVYDYDKYSKESSDLDFLSIQFETLDSIRAFEQYADKEYGIKIEMSQVNSKENFNAVSVMASILSWAMIVFSITCIIIFIVNMLQSYFQKVKRNLGTFKAFGISNLDLTKVYVFIMLAIIGFALVVSLSTAWLIECLLPMCGIMKDGVYNYLDLWNVQTFCAVGIIVLSTIVTVIVVMSRLLRQTPGDLIYDR